MRSYQIIRFGLDALRRGGRLVIVGLFGGALSRSLPLFPFRALTVMGSYVGTLDELRGLLGLVRAGHVDTVPVEMRPLDRASAALEDLRAGRVIGRVVLRP